MPPVPGLAVPSDLQTWNIVLAFVHGTFAAACAVADASYIAFFSTMIGVVWPGEYAPGAPPAGLPTFAPFNDLSSRVEVDLRLVIGSFFGVTSLAHALYASCLRPSYESALLEARQPFRWIEYAVSASIMAVCIAHACALIEWYQHLFIIALVVTCMSFGHLTEVMSRPLSAEAWAAPLSDRLLPHALGYVPLVTAFFVIGTHFAYAGSAPIAVLDASGGVVSVVPNNMPEFVYAIVATQFVGYFSFGFIQFFALLSPPRQYPSYERIYLILSAAVKVTLGLIVFTQVLFAQAADPSEPGSGPSETGSGETGSGP